MINFVQNFVKKSNKEKTENPWLGDIGSVEFEFSDVDMRVNGKRPPAEMVERFLKFASRQFLADAYAGAESLAEAQTALNDKVTRFIDGTLALRGGDSSDFDTFVQAVLESAKRSADTQAAVVAIETKVYDASDKAKNTKAKRAALADFWESKFNGLSDDRKAALLTIANAEREKARKAREEKAARAKQAGGELEI